MAGGAAASEVWSRHLWAVRSPGTWRWGAESPAAAPAFPEPSWVRGGRLGLCPGRGPCGWGRCPSARIAEDGGSWPWPRTFLSPQPKLASVSHSGNFSLLAAAPCRLHQGEARRKPWWVRSFLFFKKKKILPPNLQILPFHPGRMKDQSGILGRWGVGGRGDTCSHTEALVAKVCTAGQGFLTPS